MKNQLDQSSASIFIQCLIFAAIIISGLYFFEAARRPLASPDEGRYSEIPREMLVSGDYLTPRLNTVKYFEKPPLFYWMQAAGLKTFGNSDFGARFANVIMAILGSLITLWAGWYLFSPRIGLIGCSILSSTLLYYGISRIVILDMTVSVFITGAIATMLYALTHGSRKAMYAAYTFCALGTLTKGVIGFGIPGAVILSWIIASRQWSLIGKAINLKGVFIFLALVAPWHVWVSLKNPEFAWFYFINEHILRLTTQVHQRYQPVWFFIPIFIGGLFPWIAFFAQAARETLREKMDSLPMALLIWTGFILALFSLSQSKLIPYILPCMPPAALLIAQLFDKVWDQKRTGPLLWSFRVNALFCFALAGALHMVTLPEHALSILTQAHLYLISGLIVLIGILPYLLKRHLRLAFVALVASTMVFLLSLNHVSDLIARPSTRDLALKLKPHVTAKTPIICFEFYPQELPFYLERPVMISGWVGELEFGMSVENKSTQIFDHNTTKKTWQRADQAFIFVREDTLSLVKEILNTPLHVVAKHHNLILISKRPMV